MKKLLFILIFVILSITAQGTTQFGDILIWNGDTVNLFSNPLEHHPEWKKITLAIEKELEYQDRKIHPEKYNDDDEIEVLFHSACWRGYIAEWKIESDMIFLNNIYSCVDNVKVDLKKIFHLENEEYQIFASWINSELIIPQGKCLIPKNLGYKSVYEKELILTIESGELIDTKSYNNSIVRISKFTQDPNPNNYLDFVYSKIQWKNLPEFKSRNIQTFVEIKPTREGLIDSIIWKNSYIFDNGQIIEDKNNKFIIETIRIAKEVPVWDVIIQRDSILSCMFSLVFNEYKKEKYKHNKNV